MKRDDELVNWVAATGTGDEVCDSSGNWVTQDVLNIQDAVNKGGTVGLKGHFNFGAQGTVYVHSNVNIFGEDQASIEGGRNPFIVGTDTFFNWDQQDEFAIFVDCDYNPVPISFSIRGVSFLNFTFCAVLVLASRELRIFNNQFTGGYPTIAREDLGGHPRGGVIFVWGVPKTWKNKTAGAQDDYDWNVTGIVDISGNIIDGQTTIWMEKPPVSDAVCVPWAGPPPDREPARAYARGAFDGIGVVLVKNAEVKIAKNRISVGGRHAALFYWGGQNSAVLIADNEIKIEQRLFGEVGDLNGTGVSAEQVVTWWWNPVEFGDSRTKITLLRNKVD